MRTCKACGINVKHDKAYSWYAHDICSHSCALQYLREITREYKKIIKLIRSHK